MKIFIAGLGARTALGANAPASLSAARAGLSGLRDHPFLVDRNAEPIVFAYDELIDPGLFGAERIVRLAAAVLDEIAPSVRGPVPLYLALPEPRPGWSSNDVERIAASVSRPGFSVHPLPQGHAAALEGMRLALASGAPMSLVVGADSYLEPSTLAWLEDNRQLKSRGVRSGFPPGEAAGAILLASEEACRAADLVPLAAVVAAHSAREEKLIKTEAINVGEGLSSAIAGATAEEAVDEVLCDINGERYRTDEWAFAASRQSCAASYRTLVDCWGDIGAASGALLAADACWRWLRRASDARRALVWSSSQGGLRTAMILERVNRS